MKTLMFKIYLFVLCIAGPIDVCAQKKLVNVKVSGEEFVTIDNQLSVTLNFIVDDTRIKKDDMLILTPILKSNKNSVDSLSLSPIVLAGKQRHKMLNRKIKLGVPLFSGQRLQTIVVRDNRKAQEVRYQVLVPRQQWMTDASLSVNKLLSGCADCTSNQGDQLIAENIEQSVSHAIVSPSYQLTYIVPEVEPVKVRSDRHTATFNFVVNRFELLRNFKDNNLKFAEIDSIINGIKGNDDFQITEFTITGYASPEASVSHNLILAKNRADAFANYVMSRFGFTRDRFTVESYGEDWEGVRKAVVASDLKDKQSILAIIDRVENPDARDEQLIKLSNGQTYRTLLDEFYPPLRRTEYTIAYTVRSFDVEEAKAIIKTNPKLLSLNEMYMVAHSYGAGSREFNEVFDIAVRMYPDSEIAIMNSAAADIENNAIDRAIQQMQKLHDNPKAWNNLGVAYVLKGDLRKAMEFFSKAATTNNADAVRNLENLKKYMKGME